MSTSFNLSLFFFIIAIIIFTKLPSYAADHDLDQTTTNTTQLVDQVCNKIKNYTFCVDTLYGDPRTADADSYTLAYVSFGLAYNTAAGTRERIIELLANASAHHSRLALKRCRKDYNKAVEALGSGLNDLNSETFFTLPRYANTTSRSAGDCEAHYKPLDSSYIKSLCEICVAVDTSMAATLDSSKLLSISFYNTFDNFHASEM